MIFVNKGHKTTILKQSRLGMDLINDCLRSMCFVAIVSSITEEGQDV